MWIVFLLLGCDDHIFEPPVDCQDLWDDCEGGFTCRICFDQEVHWTECSDGWVDELPEAETSLDYDNDVCHCFPSVEGC